MLKLLDRYMLRQLLFPFLITTFGFLIFVLLFLIGNFSTWLIEGILPTDEMLLLLMYQIPQLTVLALPVSTLFAIFLSIGRMGHDREIIAMQSGGISLRRIILPLLIFGLLMSGIDLWLSNTIVPQGNRAFSQHQWQLFVNPRSTPDIRTQTYFKGGEKDLYFYVQNDRTENGVQILEGVMIYDQTNELQFRGSGGPYPRLITSESAEWRGSQWILYNGQIHNINQFGLVTEIIQFEQEIIDLSQTQLISFSSSQKRPDEMNLGELSAHIAKLGGAGLSNEKLVVDFHLKIAIPLMCLIVALFGAPLALLIGTRGRAIGIILAVLLVLIYQGLLFWTAQILGYRGDINPVLGAWLPNMLFGLIGIYFVLIANRFGRLDLLARIKRVIPFALSMPLIILSKHFSFRTHARV